MFPNIVTANNEWTVYAKTSGLLIIQNLDGTSRLQGFKSNPYEDPYMCNFAELTQFGVKDKETYEYYQEHGFNLVFSKFLSELGWSQNQLIPFTRHKELCRNAIEKLYHRYSNIEHDLDIAPNIIISETKRGLDFLEPIHPDLQRFGYGQHVTRLELEPDFKKYYVEIGTISSVEIAESINASYEIKNEEVNNLIEAYTQLVIEDALTHIGSITINKPSSIDVKFCGYASSEELIIPIEQLPKSSSSLEGDGVLNPEFVEYLKEFRANGRRPWFTEKFTSLDEFFQAWQLPDNNCNVLVATPTDISTFIHAATRVNPEFTYVLNPLWEVETLIENNAKDLGFDSSAQLSYASKISADHYEIKELENYDIKTVDKFNSTLSEVRNLNFDAYSKSGLSNVKLVLLYLSDLKEATSKSVTISDLFEIRLEEERLAEIARTEQLKIEKERLEKKIKSGDGYFAYGNCSSDVTCISKSDLAKICSSGEFGGVANKYGMNPYLYSGHDDVQKLFKNMGHSAFSMKRLYTEDNKCIFEFKASGSIDGNSISKKLKCEVQELYREDGLLYPWSVIPWGYGMTDGCN